VRILWAPLALDRVEEAADYIACDMPAAAIRWVESLFARVELLAKSPAQGRIVPESRRQDIREIQHQGYRMIFRIDERKVVILTVRHSRREFDYEELNEG
jgi:plasmid stabilization system protein ParE